MPTRPLLLHRWVVSCFVVKRPCKLEEVCCLFTRAMNIIEVTRRYRQCKEPRENNATSATVDQRLIPHSQRKA